MNTLMMKIRRLTKKMRGMMKFNRLFFLAFSFYAMSLVAMDNDPFNTPQKIDIDSLRGFFIYAKAGQFDVAQQRLDDASSKAIEIGRDTDGKQPTFDSALHLAIRLKKQGWIDQLIVHKTLLNETNKVGDSPLDLAIKEQNINVVTQLINAGSAITRNSLRQALTLPNSTMLSIILQDMNKFAEDLAEYSKLPAWLLFESAFYASSQGILYALNAYGNNNINFQDKTYQQTVLHVAAHAGCNECITILLHHGANPLIKNKYNETPLQQAQASLHALAKPQKMREGESSEQYYKPIILELGKAEAEWRAMTTAPATQAATASTPSIQQDVSADDDADWKVTVPDQKQNPLDLFFVYARQGKLIDAEKCLLNASANEIITARDDERSKATGDTVLHVAIKLKRNNWINQLIQHTALLTVVNNDNDTPLDTALMQEDIPVTVVEQLLNAGSAITRHTLMRVLTQPHADLLELIVRNNQLFDVPLTKFSSTVRSWLLFESAHWASPHGITYALNKDGADYINDRDSNSGRTPLHTAVVAGCNECIALLLKHGANPLIKDGKDKTALQLAQEAVKYLHPPLRMHMPEGQKIKEWYAPIIAQLESAESTSKPTQSLSGATSAVSSSPAPEVVVAPQVESPLDPPPVSTEQTKEAQDPVIQTQVQQAQQHNIQPLASCAIPSLDPTMHTVPSVDNRGELSSKTFFTAKALIVIAVLGGIYYYCAAKTEKQDDEDAAVEQVDVKVGGACKIL
jgi:ankyrin repeat protein